MQFKRLTLIFLCGGTSLQVLAQPSGLDPRHGTASLKNFDNVLEITVSDQTILHWDDFSNGQGEINSLGVGFRYLIDPYFTARFDYGHKLNLLPGESKRYRLHFSTIFSY